LAAKAIKRHQMRGFIRSISASLFAAALCQAASAHGRSPVVIELFTAQGCSACPKANGLLDSYADRSHVVALTFPVDYWDYLGWRDTFAQPAFTERQRAYADRLKLRSLTTPEFVIDGAREASGADGAKIDALMESLGDDPGRNPRIRVLRHGAKIQVGDGLKPRHGADVWLIRYDPALQQVKVKAGDNKGKLVSARNVVEQLERLGGWSGRARTYVAPKALSPGLKSVILVQGAKGGPIIAVAPG
jgi:hypothetical protein